MHRMLLAAAVALAVPSAAFADEIWTSDSGDVVYESEVDGTAIFSYGTDPSNRGYLYFPGLAGNYDNRSSHYGYWISPGQGSCLAPLTGADGFSSTNWGSLIIIFHKKAFPTGWTLMSGSCFGPLENTLVGTPKTGK